jgi:hypothetical protein
MRPDRDAHRQTRVCEAKMDLAGQVERPHGEPQPPPVDEIAAQAGLRLTHREPSCVHLTLPSLLRRVDFARPLRVARTAQLRAAPGSCDPCRRRKRGGRGGVPDRDDA